jgi:hypothetical protein
MVSHELSFTDKEVVVVPEAASKQIIAALGRSRHGIGVAV